jgi:catechol 2,3-dioxygenase-like lactoylglutathione lyase family enzyme
MAVRLRAVTFAAEVPTRGCQFWAEMLGREPVERFGRAFLPERGPQLGLEFVPAPTPPVRPSRLHLHLTSRDHDDQQNIVAAALRRGAAHLDVGQRPEEGHVVLADPAGYAFCVIEPGNLFLAGCGPLGEVACDGSREVGAFWSAALGWPLVWDQDEQTAIQSPHGGTKVSWGGPTVDPPITPSQQRFSVKVSGDGNASAEVERLVGLGATSLGVRNVVHVLADPGGNEFWLHHA